MLVSIKPYHRGKGRLIIIKDRLLFIYYHFLCFLIIQVRDQMPGSFKDPSGFTLAFDITFGMAFLASSFVLFLVKVSKCILAFCNPCTNCTSRYKSHKCKGKKYCLRIDKS